MTALLARLKLTGSSFPERMAPLLARSVLAARQGLQCCAPGHAVAPRWVFAFAASGDEDHAGSAVNDVCEADAIDIRASLAGDPDAYSRLIGRYQQQIAARMRWFSRQPGVCEELVQDVFVEAYLSLRSFRGRSPLSHWLQKIATRVGYRHWKTQARERRRGMTRLDDHINGLGVVTGTENSAAAGELVHALLARLGPRDRLVLTLLYLEGHSVAEAAGLAGWSVSMIKVQAFRARGKLKRILAEVDL